MPPMMRPKAEMSDSLQAEADARLSQALRWLLGSAMPASTHGLPGQQHSDDDRADGAADPKQ
jgi:hypothetical protein